MGPNSFAKVYHFFIKTNHGIIVCGLNDMVLVTGFANRSFSGGWLLASPTEALAEVVCWLCQPKLERRLGAGSAMNKILSK